MKDNTEMLALIHNTIATNNGYIEQLDKLLAQEDALIFAIPAVAAAGLKSILEVNVELITHLTEGQLRFEDELRAIVKKRTGKEI